MYGVHVFVAIDCGMYVCMHACRVVEHSSVLCPIILLYVITFAMDRAIQEISIVVFSLFICHYDFMHDHAIIFFLLQHCAYIAGKTSKDGLSHYI